MDIAENTYSEIELLSEKMIKVTKGAFSGMINGAQKAMEKEDEK
ncbi:hypothetical protein [Halarcobacter anaerophilus]|nr:hypothetical protein [Halarcobacter anaerophilus]